MGGDMLIFGHAESAGHVTPAGHPERVERLAAIKAWLVGIRADRRESPLGREVDILRCHPARYLAGVTAAALGPLDGDTHKSAGTIEAALRAVGGAVAAVEAVLAGEAKTAFVIARPPGHHAETSTAMGFCIFGTVAIAAKRALMDLDRVAVVDFDVHHGNGTQDLLWDEGRCLFISSHQMPLYPGTGDASERGGHGQILNIPLRSGGGSAAMRAAYVEQVFPALRAFQPQMILISAGFDAHEDDPLGGLLWRTEDYAWITQHLCEIAAEFCGGRVVSCLEGGYDLGALTDCVRAHVTVLEGLDER
jgi:acetoin utilization deacetylase AcuC-like enzyme